MHFADRQLPHEERLAGASLQRVGRWARLDFDERYRTTTVARENLSEQLRFASVLCVVLAGYLFFDRPFAYLRIPGTPVFVGEVVLAFGLYTVVRSHSAVTAVRSSPPLQVLLLLMALGISQLLWDIPEYGVAALRDAAIWYYALFAFIVASLLRSSSELPVRMLRWYRAIIPWYLAWAPVAVILSRTMDGGANVPGTDTDIFGFKNGNIAVHAALAVSFLWLCDEAVTVKHRGRRLVLTGLGLTAVLAAGTTHRSGLVSATVVLLATMALAKRSKAMAGTVLGCLVVMTAFVLAADLRLEQQGRDVSIGQVAENIVSLLNVSADGVQGDDDALTETVTWRLGYWSEVAVDVIDGTAGPFGYGFGSNLADRYGFQVISEDSDQPLRNAHNSHLTLMARMGLAGFILWVGLWAVWFANVLRQVRSSSSRHKSQPGFAAWLLVAAIGILLNAVFDPTLEGPQVAIWLWTIFGIGCASTSNSTCRQARLGGALSTRAWPVP